MIERKSILFMLESFDSFVDKRVAEQFKEALADMTLRISALAQVVRTPDVETSAGKKWLADTAEVQRLAFTHFRLREQYIRQLHGHVKIWCFTVDCFLQTQSKGSVYSMFFETTRIRAAFTEECHQLSILQIAAVSAIVPQHVFVYDTAQTIDHYEGGRARADNAVHRSGDRCPWEHYVCPIGPEPIDVALCPEQVFRLTWSWRLGVDMCYFMRRTTPCYSTGDGCLSSATEHWRELTPHRPEEGLARLAWKQLARSGERYGKRFADPQPRPHLLAPDPALPREQALEHLSARIWQLAASGESYGLVLASQTIPAGAGSAQLERCLTALALAPP